MAPIVGNRTEVKMPSEIKPPLTQWNDIMIDTRDSNSLLSLIDTIFVTGISRHQYGHQNYSSEITFNRGHSIVKDCLHFHSTKT